MIKAQTPLYIQLGIVSRALIRALVQDKCIQSSDYMACVKPFRDLGIHFVVVVVANMASACRE